MVTVTTEGGKIVLKDSIPIPDELAQKLEANVKTNQKAVKAAMKDIGINFWIETAGNKKLSVFSKKYTNDNVDVMEEIKQLRLSHQKFVEMVEGMEPQKPLPEEASDEEAEKFLEYALTCKLQELISSCSAIIIAIPK